MLLLINYFISLFYTFNKKKNNFCCLQKFALQRLLNRHAKCHSEIKRYLCTFCGKGFNDTFDLKRHTRTHTGYIQFITNICSIF